MQRPGSTNNPSVHAPSESRAEESGIVIQLSETIPTRILEPDEIDFKIKGCPGSNVYTNKDENVSSTSRGDMQSKSRAIESNLSNGQQGSDGGMIVDMVKIPTFVPEARLSDD